MTSRDRPRSNRVRYINKGRVVYEALQQERAAHTTGMAVGRATSVELQTAATSSRIQVQHCATALCRIHGQEEDGDVIHGQWVCKGHA